MTLTNETSPVADLRKRPLQKERKMVSLLCLCLCILGLVTGQAALAATNVSIVSITKDFNRISGQNAWFTVSASGTGGLRYQWMKDGVNLSGQTRPTLGLKSVTVKDAGVYKVRVKDANGSVTSNGVTMKVDGQIGAYSAVSNETVSTQSVVSSTSSTIKINSLSSNMSKSTGQNAWFTVSATGKGGLSYQWLKNGSALKGETRASLGLIGLTQASAGAYSVVVTDSVSKLVSKNITLLVDGKSGSGVTPVSDSQTIPGNQAKIVWNYPTRRENGTSLSKADIKYFRIYQSSGAGKSEKVYQVGGTKLEFLVTGLTLGTHYFSVSVVDSANRESDISIVVSKKVTSIN